ncbi:uncharacterized protein LOC131009495 isoform X2 [Salvia miltiorrhiza]|uniref:uncharacterized protein LOC131009495 isoform X2 n=1 Tax=Salvia miltiorrhiza TaxID=226208 RepID=UPI0025AD4183|nr:uncharacterized protein LOC131009495 isoform X2 [Salvia miltiorrhiza]
MDKFGSFKTTYHYDADTFKGEMNPGVDIFVKEESSSSSPSSQQTAEYSQKQSVNFDHPHILPCYGTQKLESKSRTLYMDFDYTLKKYIEEFGPVKKIFFPLPQNDDTERLPYEYLPNKFRRIIRGAIEGIIYLHKKKSSLESLSIDNFVVVEGEVKLGFLRLVPYTGAKTAQHDFMYLGKVLIEVFGENKEDKPPREYLPGDLQDLARCMYNYGGEGDNILLLNHLAVLTTKERVRVIKSYYVSQYYGNLQPSFATIFAEMDHQGPNPAKLVAELKARDAKFGAAVLSWCDAKAKEIEGGTTRNGAIIKMASDMATDLPRHILKTKKLGMHLGCSEEEVELSVMCIFWKHLVRFQEKANNIRILHHLV